MRCACTAAYRDQWRRGHHRQVGGSTGNRAFQLHRKAMLKAIQCAVELVNPRIEDTENCLLLMHQALP